MFHGDRKVRIECRQEVTTVKLYILNERPSELLAACAPVHDGFGRTSAPTSSREFTGHVGVRGGSGVGTSQIQARWARKSEGTTVPASALKAENAAQAK